MPGVNLGSSTFRWFSLTNASALDHLATALPTEKYFADLACILHLPIDGMARNTFREKWELILTSLSLQEKWRRIYRFWFHFISYHQTLQGRIKLLDTAGIEPRNSVTGLIDTPGLSATQRWEPTVGSGSSLVRQPYGDRDKGNGNGRLSWPDFKASFSTYSRLYF